MNYIFLLITKHETKVHTFFSSSSIRFGSIVLAETETLFFTFYSFFPTSWGNTSLYQLENKPSLSKMI